MIIGISGHISTGKTTIANIIKKYEYERSYILPFSRTIKRIAREMGWNGEKDEKGRKLLQLLGTECGRNCIGKDVWLNEWIKTLRELQKSSKYKFIIADDVRFENEVDLIRSLGGTIIYVRRPGFNGDGHESEEKITLELGDYVISNFLDISHLIQEVINFNTFLSKNKLYKEDRTIKI